MQELATEKGYGSSKCSSANLIGTTPNVLYIISTVSLGSLTCTRNMLALITIIIQFTIGNVFDLFVSRIGNIIV